MKNNKSINILLIGVLVIITIVVLVVVLFVLQTFTKKEEPKEPIEVEEQITEEESTQEYPVIEETVEIEMVDSTEEFLAVLKILKEERQEEYADALKKLESINMQENADVQYVLGEMYLRGLGTNSDLDKAGVFFEKAYLYGSERACYMYGKMSFLGYGIRQDYEKSFEAFQVMSEKSAQVNCALGLMYVFGMGTPIDYEKANQYFDKAILGDDTLAQNMKKSLESVQYACKEYQIVKTPEKKTFRKYDYSKASEDLNPYLEELGQKWREQDVYQQFGQELEKIAEMNPIIPATISIFGKDNWLFFQSDVDGSAYEDYVGSNHFTEEEMQGIVENLESYQEAVTKQGGQFVLLIIPNKESVYAEKMPSYIERVSQESRTDLLVSYIREHSSIQVIYLKDSFMNVKDELPLYYATDTHCNMVGSLFAVKEILEMYYEKTIPVSLDNFDVHVSNYTGDIGVMLGREDRYCIDKVYFPQKHKITSEQKVEGSMVLIGDSFSDFINVEASMYFTGGVQHYMVTDYEFDVSKTFTHALSQGTTDLVVLECVERYISRLK